jgi:hypothetical protein
MMGFLAFEDIAPEITYTTVSRLDSSHMVSRTSETYVARRRIVDRMRKSTIAPGSSLLL